MAFSPANACEADVDDDSDKGTQSMISLSPPQSVFIEKMQEDSSCLTVGSVEIANNDTNDEMEFGGDDDEE